MSHSDIIKEHAINEEFLIVNEKIENALNIAKDNHKAKQAVNRIKAIIKSLKTSYNNCPNIFIDISWLDECKSAITKIGVLLDAYCNSGSVDKITIEVKTNLTILLNNIVKFNCVRNKQSLNGTQEAFDVYIESLLKEANNFDKKVELLNSKLNECDDEISKANEHLEASVNIIKNNINKEQLRLDGFADKYQLQKQEDQIKFQEFLVEISNKFNNDREEFDCQKENLIKEYKKTFDGYVTQVEDIVGTVNANMFSYKYQDVANNAMERSFRWHRITLCLLLGLIIFAIFAFMISPNENASLFDVMAKIFTTSAIATAAAYTARQASKQERVERYARQIEMELVSLEPYLLSLQETTKEKIKEDLAYKYFGKEDAMELKKNENGDTKAIEKFTEIIMQRIGKLE